MDLENLQEILPKKSKNYWKSIREWSRVKIQGCGSPFIFCGSGSSFTELRCDLLKLVLWRVCCNSLLSAQTIGFLFPFFTTVFKMLRNKNLLRSPDPHSKWFVKEKYIYFFICYRYLCLNKEMHIVFICCDIVSVLLLLVKNITGSTSLTLLNPRIFSVAEPVLFGRATAPGFWNLFGSGYNPCIIFFNPQPQSFY